MLVELYCRDNVGASTTCSSLFQAANVPASAASRWLRHLQQVGFVICKAHPTEPGVGFVEMSQDAKKRLERYLTRVRAAAAEETDRADPT